MLTLTNSVHHSVTRYTDTFIVSRSVLTDCVILGADY